jgi:hypothetical protein
MYRSFLNPDMLVLHFECGTLDLCGISPLWTNWEVKRRENPWGPELSWLFMQKSFWRSAFQSCGPNHEAD